MPELFKRVHEQPSTHHASSAGAVFSHFAQEWNNFILSARSGMFDGYPSLKDYPISTRDLTSSGYIQRQIFEERFRAALSEKADIIVLGHEGSGKTTLVHYVLGHLAYSVPISNLISIYVDTRSLNLPNTFLTSQLFTELYTQLVRVRLDKHNTLGETIGGELRAWLESKPLLAPLLLVEPQLNQLAAMIAFLSKSRPDQITYFAIDNADSLNPEALRTLIQYIEALRAAATRFLRIAEKDSVQCTLRFILPCRTATWLYITNAAIGHIPFRQPQTVILDQKIHSVWELTKTFIRAGAPAGDAYKEYAKTLALTISLRPGATYTWSQTVEDVLVEVIEWIQERCPTAEKIIASFGGHSLRRQKMYALKVLGHAAVVRSWARTNLGESGRHPKELRAFGASYTHEDITEIVKEALFDAMQPFGDGMVATEILLNPFGAVTERELRLRNPYVGINLLRLIKDKWDVLHTTAVLSDQIAIGPIVTELEAIGYEQTAICQCIESFCMSGVLRPIKSHDYILTGKRELQNVVPQYTVDKEALDLYYRLVFRTGKDSPDSVASKENSILFMNACTRANYGVGYATRFGSPVYTAYVNLTFLKDAHAGDSKLSRLAQESGYSGALRAYVPEVFVSLKKKWQPALDGLSSTIQRHNDELEREMYDKARTHLEDLTVDARNGRMKEWLTVKSGS